MTPEWFAVVAAWAAVAVAIVAGLTQANLMRQALEHDRGAELRARQMELYLDTLRFWQELVRATGKQYTFELSSEMFAESESLSTRALMLGLEPGVKRAIVDSAAAGCLIFDLMNVLELDRDVAGRHLVNLRVWCQAVVSNAATSQTRNIDRTRGPAQEALDWCAGLDASRRYDR